MRKKFMACFLALFIMALPVTALAGNMPISGIASQGGDAPAGYEWMFVDGLWWIISL